MFTTGHAMILLGEKFSELYDPKYATLAELTHCSQTIAKRNTDLLAIPAKIARFLGMEAWKDFHDAWINLERSCMRNMTSTFYGFVLFFI